METRRCPTFEEDFIHNCCRWYIVLIADSFAIFNYLIHLFIAMIYDDDLSDAFLSALDYLVNSFMENSPIIYIAVEKRFECMCLNFVKFL